MPDRYLGRQIGKYRVIRLLGTGAFAWVYEAIDRDLEIPVALKILRPEFAGEATAEARFRREAATAARLRHPNIVTVRDVGQADGASFVAMDLQPLSLARRLELVSRLPEPEVVRLGLDVAAALAIAHAGGIIHRDIKPDNILIGAAGEAVVADFGLARALSSDASLSATNQVMGTPHYFSPEQARGLELDGRSDLYALGVTMYRAVTGTLPFEGDDWYAVARHHVESPVPPPRSLVPDITPAFETVMLRLLAKRPEDRYETAIQLADALATLPTAPPERGTTMTPHSSSQTVFDFNPQPALARASRTRWLRRARNVGLLAIIGSALWGAERQRGVFTKLFDRTRSTVDSLPPSVREIADRVKSEAAATGRDIGVLLGDTTKRDSLAPTVPPLALPPAVRPGTTIAPRPRAAVTARVVLTIAAPESAALYVDGVRVGTGEWTGERAAPASLVARAVIGDAQQVDCRSAQRDTILRVRPGDRLTVTIPVRACVGIEFDVTPREARIVFNPLDGGVRVDTRADATPAVTVPTGRYAVTATSPRCAVFVDTLLVRRKPDGEPTRLRARMTCN